MRARDTQSGDLFAVPQPALAVPASMDFRATVAHLVSDALRGSSSDRYGVAAAMSRLAGKDVSKAMLDGYSAEAREAFNLPLYLVPAFEVAAATHVLTDWLAQVRGAQLLYGQDALTAELGRLEREREAANDRIRALKDHMRRSR